jgi:hypothetical protein
LGKAELIIFSLTSPLQIFSLLVFWSKNRSADNMPHKLSGVAVEKNKAIWSTNLVRYQETHAKRRSIQTEELPISEKTRMPLKTHIMGRFQFLGIQVKGRKQRIAEICKEVTQLWENKLNFPHVSDQVIRTKIEKTLKIYDECVRRGNYDALNELFDITKVDGLWLSAEDKKLYLLQVNSKGKIGYATNKAASQNTIHPSKRRKTHTESTTPFKSASPYNVSASDSGSMDCEPEDESCTTPPKRKHNKSRVATNLVTSAGVSTRKAAIICQQLSRDGIDIAAPCQSAIYKATFREAAKVEEEMKSKLQKEQWSLHFDGKKMEDVEYQVVVLKNESNEVKLKALRLEDGKAETISMGIAKVIDEYNLWQCIKMIVADTTSVNTGKKNGVVVRLQRMFVEKGLTPAQFISCQHHVLDRILRVTMDEELRANTKSPNIDYPFVSQLITEYEDLKTHFVNGTEPILDQAGWRDDMKFLYHLTRVFRFYVEKGHFPLIKFQKIPNISNARWNSRAIVAILAFILIPQTRMTLEKVCRFISYDWADYWFSDQFFNPNDYINLSNCLTPYKKASQILQNHWKKEPSTLNIPRTNQCAERAIKVMQELYASCVNKDKLNYRFILTNKQ